MKENDRYHTPAYIIEAITRTMGVQITHDVCAEDWSAVTASYWDLKAGEDALKYQWSDHFPPLSVMWCNPPYSALPQFTAKCRWEAHQGLIIVGLVPDSRSSRWYQDNVENVATTVFLPDGRLNFIKPDGTVKAGNPWPSCFPVWTPWRTGTTTYARFNRKLGYE